MKLSLILIIFSLVTTLFGQQKIKEIKKLTVDNVQAIYDSLDKVYYFNNIELNTSESKFNFKPGQIPYYDDAVYQTRINDLASKSPFNYRYNKIVQNYITMYSKRIKSTGTILSLSQLYFPLFEKYLSQFNVPLELKYLSIVESALNPTAISPCGASGLWQFMYGTGKGYKLEINSYVDERFDPEKETIAACHYLKDLYAIYGQWDLAIAAYNCGPGNVNKAIKRAGGIKDFWLIYDYLPKETQGYVPAFIAASYICEYHDEHNIQPVAAKFLFDELDVIEIDYKVSLKQMAKLLSIEYKQLKYLNPKYITDIVPGNKNFIIVPKQKALEYIDIEVALQNGLKPKSNTINNSNLTFNNKIEAEKENAVVFNKSLPGIKNSYNTDNDLFGTYKPKLEEQILTDNYIRVIEESKLYSVVAYGDQSLFNGSQIKLLTTDIISYNDLIIPKNSILKGTVSFKKKSIIVNITSAQLPGGNYSVIFSSEINDTPQLKYFLEDKYLLLIKS